MKTIHTTMQVDETVQALIDTKIICAEFPEGTCAIESEFQELSNKAFDNSIPENPQHFVSLLDIGQDALLARLHLIRSAQKTIEMQVYIWSNDEVGQLVFHELLRAARRGVKVRIIADQLGSQEDPSLIARLATAHENLEIAFYNPVFSHGKTTPLTLTRGMFSMKRIDQRMHNKILVVDERIGIAGGRNIENKYYDYDPAFSFKDRDVMVIGPVAIEMRESFERYWNSDIVVKAIYLVDVGREITKLEREEKPALFNEPDMSLFSDIDMLANQYSITEERPAIKPLSADKVKFFADLPGKPPKREIEEYKNNPAALREVVQGAQTALTVQTPYLVLSRTARSMLRKMKRRNPDLEITVSTNSLASTDVPMIYGITYKQKRDIIKNLKVKLYEMKPFPGDVRKYISRYDRLTAVDSPDDQSSSPEQGDMLPVMKKGLRVGLHAKSLVIDSSIAIIGSHNLDPRSANINTESIIIIWDKNVAQVLEQNILLDTEPQNSWVITKRQKVPFIGHFSEVVGSVSQILPVFDIWPFQYSSSFELKKGMEPVPADHPAFYIHYSDVGQFPEINVSIKAAQTRMIKAFGGFITPLM